MTDINGVRSEDETAVPGRRGSGLRLAGVLPGALPFTAFQAPHGFVCLGSFDTLEQCEAAARAVNNHDERVGAVAALACAFDGAPDELIEGAFGSGVIDGVRKCRAACAKATSQS